MSLIYFKIGIRISLNITVLQYKIFLLKEKHGGGLITTGHMGCEMI